MIDRIFWYLLDHPELWGYLIIPLLGFLVGELGRLVARRFPRTAPAFEWLIHKLPVLQGAFERWQRAKLHDEIGRGLSGHGPPGGHP